MRDYRVDILLFACAVNEGGRLMVGGLSTGRLRRGGGGILGNPPGKVG